MSEVLYERTHCGGLTQVPMHFKVHTLMCAPVVTRECIGRSREPSGKETIRQSLGLANFLHSIDPQACSGWAAG